MYLKLMSLLANSSHWYEEIYQVAVKIAKKSKVVDSMHHINYSVWDIIR